MLRRQAGSARLCKTCNPMTQALYGWECEACPHEGLPREEKTYKSGIERDRSGCKLCNLCGGVDQDGLFYEQHPCTVKDDAICQRCPPCAKGTIRVGCALSTKGYCVVISSEVSSIIATAQMSLGWVPAGTEEGVSFFRTPLGGEVFLSGKYAGNGVRIAPNTTIKGLDVP
ncbi:hypothetical protein T484DRAFT_1779832, partial [Baffinella frigidus]